MAFDLKRQNTFKVSKIYISLCNLIDRWRGFRYFCNCVENCWKKEHPTCEINKETRNNCKYCRYEKCLNLAGMNCKWVISAHILKVGRNPNKKKPETKTKNGSIDKDLYDNASDKNLFRNVESIYKSKEIPDSEILKVFFVLR